MRSKFKIMNLLKISNNLTLNWLLQKLPIIVSLSEIIK